MFALESSGWAGVERGALAYSQTGLGSTDVVRPVDAASRGGR
jgi:hypothetical protein